VRDLFDAPRRGAEHERLADAALEDHFLVELANARRSRPGAEQEDAVESAIGNGAAVGDGDALGAFARRDSSRNAVPRDARPQLRELVGRIAAGQHVEHAFEDRPAQLGERRGAADRREQLVDVPVVHRRHRDDLLSDDVERVARIARGLDDAVVHRFGDRGARDEVAAEFREDDALADRVGGMAAAADALQAAGHRRRRLDLHDEIDGAHVDAELERRGGDERAQHAGLEEILHFDALRPRDRPVMRADQRFARELVEGAGEPLGEAAAVDEDERRAVGANQLEEARVNRRPDRPTRIAKRCRTARNIVQVRQLGHVLDRHVDRQLQLLLLSGVDDGDGAVADRAAVCREFIFYFAWGPTPTR